MIKLEKNGYEQIYTLYLGSKFFFPLIAAVLLKEQDGSVYVNDLANPTQAYVEHAFGFSQILGNPDENFEQELQYYLLRDKSFAPGKIRLYAPYLPGFLTPPAYESLCSYRQRFILNKEAYKRPNKLVIEKELTIGEVDATNVVAINNIFGVATRFWRSLEDFALCSRAVVIYYKGEPASLCYSAAEANGCVEIDVLTLPEYRNQGLAKLAVIHFVKRCLDLSLLPLWDCFTNNAGSMMLCRTAGFLPAYESYPFFTITK